MIVSSSAVRLFWVCHSLLQCTQTLSIDVLHEVWRTSFKKLYGSQMFLSSIQWKITIDLNRQTLVLHALKWTNMFVCYLRAKLAMSGVIYVQKFMFKMSPFWQISYPKPLCGADMFVCEWWWGKAVLAQHMGEEAGFHARFVRETRLYVLIRHGNIRLSLKLSTERRLKEILAQI